MDIHSLNFVWLIGAFALGLLNCFFGYRLFLVIVAILGIAVGATLGYSLGQWVGANYFVSVVLAVLVAFIGAWASVTAYYAFIFVIGAFAFAFATAFVAGLYAPHMSRLLLVVIGLVGGVIALWLQRVIIIIATAAQGSLASVLAVAVLISGGGVNAFRTLYYRILEGSIIRGGGIWFYVAAAIWLLLFLFGMFAQFTRGKEMYRRPRPASA